VNYGVGRNWYGWAYDRLCDLGSHPVCVYINVQEWKVAIFFFFHHELYVVVQSIEMVEEFCKFFLSMWPDNEGVVCISEPTCRFVCCLFYGCLSKSSIKKLATTGESCEPIATQLVC
jgi:hypothetical protein